MRNRTDVHEWQGRHGRRGSARVSRPGVHSVRALWVRYWGSGEPNPCSETRKPHSAQFALASSTTRAGVGGVPRVCAQSSVCWGVFVHVALVAFQCRARPPSVYNLSSLSGSHARSVDASAHTRARACKRNARVARDRARDVRTAFGAQAGGALRRSLCRVAATSGSRRESTPACVGMLGWHGVLRTDLDLLRGRQCPDVAPGAARAALARCRIDDGQGIAKGLMGSRGHEIGAGHAGHRIGAGGGVGVAMGPALVMGSAQAMACGHAVLVMGSRQAIGPAQAMSPPQRKLNGHQRSRPFWAASRQTCAP